MTRFFSIIFSIMFLPLLFAQSGAQFIENKGQLDPAIKYQLHAAGSAISLTETGITFASIGTPEQPLFAETFLANGAGVSPIGNVPSAIARHLDRAAAFSTVAYQRPWPGIDLLLSGAPSGIRHQFIVQPGADAAMIRIALEGTANLQIDSGGALTMMTSQGIVRQEPSEFYQEIGGARVRLSGRYQLTGPQTYGFAPDNYARQYPLVITTAPAILPQSTPALAPVITFFNVAPTSTLPGEAVIGTLLVTGATSATVNGILANCSAGSCGGTFLFAPSSSTNYIMQATGAGGATTASQQVEVGTYQLNPPPDSHGTAR